MISSHSWPTRKMRSLHQRLDRGPTGDEVRVFSARWDRKRCRMGESWMGQRRCDCLPPGLLSKSGPARAGNLLANSRGCGVLARARCARVVSISGRNETKGRPRRYLSGVGANHGTLRPGESEKILCAVVCFIVSTEM